ncbi:MAG: hypothetical protein ACE5PO_00060 [Candidatus Bathyarchaeia archaeon]
MCSSRVDSPEGDGVRKKMIDLPSEDNEHKTLLEVKPAHRRFYVQPSAEKGLPFNIRGLPDEKDVAKRVSEKFGRILEHWSNQAVGIKDVMLRIRRSGKSDYTISIIIRGRRGKETFSFTGKLEEALDHVSSRLDEF